MTVHSATNASKAMKILSFLPPARNVTAGTAGKGAIKRLRSKIKRGQDLPRPDTAQSIRGRSTGRSEQFWAHGVSRRPCHDRMEAMQ